MPRALRGPVPRRRPRGLSESISSATIGAARNTRASLAVKFMPEHTAIAIMLETSGVEVQQTSTERRECEIAGERHRAVQYVKAGEPDSEVSPRRRRTIAPGPLVVPREIMKDRGFNREARREQVVPAHDLDEECDHGELDRHSREAHEIEGSPAREKRCWRHAGKGVNRPPSGSRHAGLAFRTPTWMSTPVKSRIRRSWTMAPSRKV